MALTIHQPWATLIAHGAKRVETRGWQDPYRGDLLIHAAKGGDVRPYFPGLFPEYPDGAGGRRWAVNAEDALQIVCEQDPFLDPLILAGYGSAAGLERGMIIAHCRIARMVEMTEASIVDLQQRNPTEHAFGIYEPGRFAWVLTEVTRLEQPVVCRGGQKLWRPPGDVLAAVREQVPSLQVGYTAVAS